MLVTTTTICQNRVFRQVFEYLHALARKFLIYNVTAKLFIHVHLPISTGEVNVPFAIILSLTRLQFSIQ